MMQGENQLTATRPLRRQRHPRISPARILGTRLGSLDVRRTDRKLKVMLLVGASFVFMWFSLTVFAQPDLWPLLAAPILLSAWFFYEVGVLAALALTGSLLLQVSLEKPVTVAIAMLNFGLIGLGIAWALRRQRRMHGQILRSSLTDALTGLYNYGHFMRTLDREMHRVERYGGEITIVMFDIDHFKMFNDRFGHHAGNDALQLVASVIRQEKRESDIAARFGGEEFVLLLPGDIKAGTETAERLRQAVAGIKIPVGPRSKTGITVSAGVASYPQGAASRQELLDRVDQLLYLSKRNGRNRVSAASAGRRLAV